MIHIKDQIEADIKQAMLAGDKHKVITLRGLKSAILYVEVAKGARQQGLTDAEIIDVLSKESKKRQESADMYTQGGSPDRALAEIAEKSVIETYLPKQLSNAELEELIVTVIDELGSSKQNAMGQVITEVKKRSSGQADGSRIAKIVKEKLK